MKEKSKVELFERIRRDRRLDDVSIREMARRHNVHRRTVRDVLASAIPTPRKTVERDAPAMGRRARGKTCSIAAHSPGAPSVAVSTGEPSPRGTMPSRKPTHASVDSALTPSRCSRIELPSVVIP